mmetsp:Transcript_23758/g.67165  ORF Transcript_23758/g.67165 Transcript_23758/m.67165 type:complete len:110 (-) Transcript_23758:132-461(-)|eukprot:CAMPEP_0119546934 /NCGR_PEP_ID=MMETSP1352-20130426/1169_1 /TAXON_ID=265584 /ORGANISM="Stauroneis constricta, Strain CCMP1120" /LENGTH=109 /DNA_ID=CAMNT_0007591707 /DNA_START=173 /DNA_END=502 /DNA_ORIENTATION=-
MVHPITAFCKSLQETEESRIGRMSERVAENSIDSQKKSDEYKAPQYFGHMWYLGAAIQPRAYNTFTTSHSYFCNKKEGAGSSFIACRYYTDEARKKRDALVAEVATMET